MYLLRTLKATLLLAFITVLAGTGKAQQSQTATLAGYNTVAGVKSAATGTIKATLKSDSLTIEGSFSDLSNYYYGSAIFYGEEGERGNQLIDLNPDIAENRTSGTFKASKNTFKLTEGQLEALSNGNLYVSILSFDYKQGELRAQIPPLKNE